LKEQYYKLSEVKLTPAGKPLRVLLLADDRHPANVVSDHIDAFTLHSINNVEIVNPIHEECPENLSDSGFDAIIIHYSIYILSRYFLPSEWVNQITHFRGPKIQVIQDEYRNIDKMKIQMCTLRIHAVLSSLNIDNAKKVYNGEFLEKIKVYSCLPGYFHDRLRLLRQKPLKDRQYDIVYRGRIHASPGLLSSEKVDIGLQMSLASEEYDLKVNISSEESSRIYGEDWDQFLMSGRAMLGVEGGSSIFDFDGSLKDRVDEYLQNNIGVEFDEIWEKFWSQHEGNIVHKTITPKIFEAISAKTALVLYPGEYSGILVPDRHYIVLNKDGSNIKEVVKKLHNNELLSELVERTYLEIAEREDLSYQYYIGKVDVILRGLMDSDLANYDSFREAFFKEELVLVRCKYFLLKEKILELENTMQSERQSYEQNLVQIENELRLKILELEDKLHSSNHLLEMSRDVCDFLRMQVEINKK
jgi:hypothetical protein